MLYSSPGVRLPRRYADGSCPIRRNVEACDRMAALADRISLRDLDPSGSRRSVDFLRAECMCTPRDQGLHARAGTQTAQEAGTARLPRIEARRSMIHEGKVRRADGLMIRLPT